MGHWDGGTSREESAGRRERGRTCAVKCQTCWAGGSHWHRPPSDAGTSSESLWAMHARATSKGRRRPPGRSRLGAWAWRRLDLRSGAHGGYCRRFAKGPKALQPKARLIGGEMRCGCGRHGGERGDPIREGVGARRKDSAYRIVKIKGDGSRSQAHGSETTERGRGVDGGYRALKGAGWRTKVGDGPDQTRRINRSGRHGRR